MDVDRTMFNWRKYVYPLIHTLLTPPFGGNGVNQNPLADEAEAMPKPVRKVYRNKMLFAQWV